LGLSIQQQLGQNTTVEVGYEGTRSVHEMQIFEFNDARPGPEPRIERRPFPALTPYRVLMGNGDQSYNALNFKVEKRPDNDGITMLFAYTWAKSLGTTGGRLSIVGDTRGISRNLLGNLRQNQGRGEANIPGRLAALGGYDIPFGPGADSLVRILWPGKFSVAGACSHWQPFKRASGTQSSTPTGSTWSAT